MLIDSNEYHLPELERIHGTILKSAEHYFGGYYA
jgi:hypothetical protein